MKFSHIIIKAYEVYKSKIPLDLTSDASQFLIENWRKNHQLSILEYSRIVYFICEHRDLSDFSSADFDFDMDNIAPVLESIIDIGILLFKESTAYEILATNKFHYRKSLFFSGVDVLGSPNSRYNQFPCDVDSRNRRVEQVIKDYPFVESMNFGIFGDDDLISLEMVDIDFLNPIVFEIDDEVIHKIKKYAKEKIEVRKLDLSDGGLSYCDKDLDTFIADPPYNLNGVFCFIYCGLKRLRTFGEFYLIINQMMLGKGDILKLQQILAQSGIFLKKILPAFSRYNLPKNYRETADLMSFLEKVEGKLENTKSYPSSSSSLFVFNSAEINMKSLDDFFESKNLIYQRYEG